MSQSPCFAMVAGEASGDLLGGALLAACRQRWPQLRAVGIGGAAMDKQGFEAWWPERKLAVRGYVEVLPHLRELLAIRKQLRERLLAAPPDVFIGVDAPDFNLDLEIALRTRGVATVHFVSPSFWAWRARKVEKLRAAADHVLCLFPFEPELLAAHGVQATYVGHPLAAMIALEPDRQAARVSLGLPAGGPVVALLPGSRQAEVKHLAGRFFAAARLLWRERPELRFVVPVLPALRSAVEQAAQQAGWSGREGEALHLVEGRSHQVLAACDAALVASGTATLEAALFKRPMVIAYHMPWLSWQIMRRKQLQPWVGLPNVLCRDFVVPELLQERATPEALAEGLLYWLDHPQEAQALAQRFEQLHHELRRDTARLACDAIEKIIAA
ncbi:MAG: lipid-A-disaccharide synthase [Betaproteobacteria bacterium]